MEEEEKQITCLMSVIVCGGKRSLFGTSSLPLSKKLCSLSPSRFSSSLLLHHLASILPDMDIHEEAKVALRGRGGSSGKEEEVLNLDGTEWFIKARACADAVMQSSVQQENLMLRLQLEAIVEVNSSLKRAVVTQQKRQKETEDQSQELQGLGQMVTQYQEQLKQVCSHASSETSTAEQQYMMPAIINIHKALFQLGLDRYIQVSSPSSLAVLAESYPPSAGSFKPEVTSVMQQFLRFLEATRSPFWINAYPYFAYKDNPNTIPIDYVLFNRNIGMTDPNTGLHYDNMMYAQVDAVAFAAAKLGYRNIEVRVAETGWPSKGDVGEIGASPLNAAAYIRNLMMRQFAGEGTPARRSSRLEVYIFALFNEDMKPGPISEKNYGIFQPDGSLAYDLGFSTMSTTSTTTATSKSVTYSSSATKAKSTLKYWKILILAMIGVSLF
ncbi:hypothetical protein DY000_02009490 [Brassica cretica]|uniref:glucan endo-1,3-beta-D-glucosidase n=1 Tax=Brassica cretica TaxID=69181 RepID=A0ABQ7BXK3_BRACR|nr:hypothetical protein DY000_02009490 [Brassica cretica]